ncbi:MAG: alpha/beta fold hydrolase [Streptosporangiaceae bacterium]
MTTNLAADFTAELSSVTRPALILHGDHGVFAPLADCGRRSAELMPASRLVVYGGAAYLPHLSRRERLNADLLAFAGGRDA